MITNNIDILILNSKDKNKHYLISFTPEAIWITNEMEECMELKGSRIYNLIDQFFTEHF